MTRERSSPRVTPTSSPVAFSTLRARSPAAICRKRPIRSAHAASRPERSRSARRARSSNGIRSLSPASTPHARISAASCRTASAAADAAARAADRMPGTAAAIACAAAAPSSRLASSSAASAASTARRTAATAGAGTSPCPPASAAACRSASPTSAAVASARCRARSARPVRSLASRDRSSSPRSADDWASTARAAAYASPAVSRCSAAKSGDCVSAATTWWWTRCDGAITARSRRRGGRLVRAQEHVRQQVGRVGVPGEQLRRQLAERRRARVHVTPRDPVVGAGDHGRGVPFGGGGGPGQPPAGLPRERVERLCLFVHARLRAGSAPWTRPRPAPR